MIPIYALSGKCSLPFFLFEARGNGWTVLETVGSERMERGERRREEIEGDVEEAKAKKLPVIDCYQYRANGPTVVVLGKGCHIRL